MFCRGQGIKYIAQSLYKEQGGGRHNRSKDLYLDQNPIFLSKQTKIRLSIDL